MNGLSSVPMFVRSMPKDSKDITYVNTNDITKITKISNNYWEADAINGKNLYGGPAVYHFDDNSAMQIINNMTGNSASKVTQLPNTVSQYYQANS